MKPSNRRFAPNDNSCCTAHRWQPSRVTKEAITFNPIMHSFEETLDTDSPLQVKIAPLHTDDTRLEVTEDTSAEAVTCHVNRSLHPQLDGVASSIAVRIAICIGGTRLRNPKTQLMCQERGGGSLLRYTRLTGPP